MVSINYMPALVDYYFSLQCMATIVQNSSAANMGVFCFAGTNTTTGGRFISVINTTGSQVNASFHVLELGYF